MASEIKVDTISEKTSANGVTIDGVNIKDSALATAGSVPLSTIDIDGGTDIGAAVVDADLFIIDDGAGGTNRKVTASRLKTYAGTTINNATANEIVTIASTTTELDAEANLTFDGNALVVGGTAPSITIGDAGAEDTKLVFDGNALDFHIGLDDSADKLVIGKGSALGTTTAMSFDTNGIVTKPLNPLFKVQQTSALSVADGHTVFSSNTTEAYDVNADFASGSFTAPVDGYYLFSATVTYTGVTASTDTFEDLIVSSNQTELLTRVGMLADAFVEGGYLQSWNSTILFMDANDTCFIQHSDGGTLSVTANANMSHFEGCLLQ